MKIPKIPNPISRRAGSGALEVIGLTGGEWALSLGFIGGLYGIFAGYFAVLILIAQKIQNGRNYYPIPGTEDSVTFEEFEE